MNKNVLKSIADGVLQFLGLKFVLAISELLYNDYLSDTFIVIDVMTAALLAIIYFILLFNELSNKNILSFSLLSICCFILSELLNFFSNIVFQSNSIADDNPAFGIVIIITIVIFVFSSLIFRLCFLLALIVRNKKRKAKEKTGDGSLSCGR